MTAVKITALTFTIVIFAFSCSIDGVHSFDYDELEIFDIVEEINQNFYELLGIHQDDSSSDVRRAYRKLSLQFHPDRNKEADAELKFRQLAAVYEVLKDGKKREIYDSVLVNGLPDWRQPIYYYRRARKLSLIELILVLLLIFTVGHFIVIWSIYFERRFEMEDVFRSRKRKRRTRHRGGGRSRAADADEADEEFEELLAEELLAVPRPTVADVLPWKLVRLMVVMATGIPEAARTAGEMLRRKIAERRRDDTEGEGEEEEEDAKLRHAQRRRQRVDAMPDVIPMMCESHGPVVYTNLEDNDAESEGVADREEDKKMKCDKEWTDDDVLSLVKAMVKFPGGTPARWEKISHLVGRSISDVTAKSKKIKSKYAVSVDPAAQGISMSSAVTIQRTSQGAPPRISDDVMTTRIDWQHSVATMSTPAADGDDDTASTRTAEQDVADQWTQNQQKIFEWALAQYPRSTTERRWEKIAEHIPGKTKEECIARFRYLAEVVKKRKAQQTAKS